MQDPHVTLQNFYSQNKSLACAHALQSYKALLPLHLQGGLLFLMLKDDSTLLLAFSHKSYSLEFNSLSATFLAQIKTASRLQRRLGLGSDIRQQLGHRAGTIAFVEGGDAFSGKGGGFGSGGSGGSGGFDSRGVKRGGLGGVKSGGFSGGENSENSALSAPLIDIEAIKVAKGYVPLNVLKNSALANEIRQSIPRYKERGRGEFCIDDIKDAHLRASFGRLKEDIARINKARRLATRGEIEIYE